VEIYVATFAGLLSSLLLAVVYLADRYEPEPIELIQNSFLTGLAGQLALIFVASSLDGGVFWSGKWLMITIIAAAFYLPFRLHLEPEMDERFDGIVYSVAMAGGATCAIHLNNLPRVMAVSPYRDALASGAEPDLRDLLILAGSAGFTAELGRGLVVILAAVLVGFFLGVLQFRGWPPWRTALVCVAVGSVVVGADLLVGGGWCLRGGLLATAVVAALAVKRRSVFRDRPQTREGDVLLLALKTVLIVFGAALLAMVLLQAVVEQPQEGHGLHGLSHFDDRPESGSVQ
jgi:hypothetical protein